MRKIVISGIVGLLVSSCISMNQFVVTQVGEEPEKYSQRFIYSLPQTVLEVKLEVEKTIFLPGPYRQFSEKYLGISQYIREEKTEWKISGAGVSEYSEPDPMQYYSVNLVKGFFRGEEYFDLASRGLVINPMGVIASGIILPTEKQAEMPAVLELSMKRSHKEKTDTLFKTVITDSSFVKIPILRKQKDAKTLEQKAEEAANLIIKIRKRRLKLVTGEYNVFPEGQALETALEELSRTEKEYIALFTGKIYSEKYIRSYFIVPDGQTEKTEFMKFSREKGILPADSEEGIPVTIEVSRLEDFTSILPGEERNPLNTLYFRLPSTCSLRLTEADKLLYEARISLFQAGSVLPLPLKMKRLNK